MFTNYYYHRTDIQILPYVLCNARVMVHYTNWDVIQVVCLYLSYKLSDNIKVKI